MADNIRYYCHRFSSRRRHRDQSPSTDFFETLLDTDDQERLQPMLAESWETSPDGKTITLHLRKGVKFHDGTDFNAEAVKFNFDIAKAKNIAAASGLKFVNSYVVTDPYTLQVNLTQPDCTFLLRLAQTPLGMMASPTAMQKTGDDITALHMVGTGPFKYDSWQRDTFAKSVRWDGYWQKGRPYLDAIEVRQVADVTVGLMAFKKGDFHIMANVDPGDAIKLKAEGYEIYVPKLHLFHSLCPDAASADSPFADVRVRQAVEYAIDKQAIADGIGMGTFEALSQYASTKDPWYNASLPVRKYDPAKAKKLHADAGYPAGFKSTIVTDTRVRWDTVQAIQTNLKEVGIDCTIDIADVARMTDMTRKGWKGLLLTGFPRSTSSLTSLLTGYGQDYPSMYRPVGWQDRWDTLVTQYDYDKRTAQLRDIVKSMMMLMVMAGLLRTSYALNHAQSDIQATLYLEEKEPMQKQWAEKAVRRYAETQEKKWRNWNEAMFEPVN